VVNPSHIVRKVTTTRIKSTRGLNNYYNMLTYQPAKWAFSLMCWLWLVASKRGWKLKLKDEWMRHLMSLSA